MECTVDNDEGHIKYGFDGKRARKIVRILIGSKFYFDLSLPERHNLIRHILSRFPFSL
jgi:stress-induced morphogen